MYERKIYSLAGKRGSGALPSLLKINSETHYSSTQEATNLISNGTIYSRTGLNGSIGNNYNEFSIDFHLDPNVTKVADAQALLSPKMKSLFEQVKNDIFISIPLKFLTENFKLYEFPDYSAQSMSMRNYDYYIKVFTYDPEAQKFYKISSKAVAVLKSFTMKKSWLIIDGNVPDLYFDAEHPEKDAHIVIDFIYKPSKLEEEKNQLKNTQKNNYANLQGLFSEAKYASPYFDTFYYELPSNRNIKMNVMEKQGGYFTYTVADNFDHTFKSLSETPSLYNIGTIYRSTMIKNSDRNMPNSSDTKKNEAYNTYNNEITFNFDKFRLKYMKAAEATTYKDSLSYEIYAVKSNYLCERCFHSLITSGIENYEVYPVMSDMIHYVYEINSGTVTKEAIHKELKRLGQYLYNYDFQTYNTFSANGKNYVELYIPYHYDGLNIIDDETIDGYSYASGSQLVLKADSTTSTDIRSEFDPTRTTQEAYTNNSNYIVPYFGNDHYMTDALLNNNIRVYSEDLLIEDIRPGSLYNKYFDILDANIDTSSNNIINSESVIAAFNNAQFRADNINTVYSRLNNLDAQNLILCKNLNKLRTSNNKSAIGTPSGDISMRDCFFIYLESTKDYLTVEFNYDLDTGHDYDDVQLKRKYYPYATENGKNCFIIASEPTLVSINCDASSYIKYY